MAAPQKENGYTGISNELMEALAKTYFSSRETQILFGIIRKTYGYNKKMDKISFTQLECLTGMNRRHIAPALKKLIVRRIIIREGEGQSLSYGIQKDYDQWDRPLPKSVTVSTDTTITETGNAPLPKSVTKPLPKSVNTIERKTCLKKYSVNDFEKFWAIFPNGELGNKGSKKRAREEFLKLNPSNITIETLTDAVLKQAEYKRSLKGKNNFMEKFQHVERWLKNERWTDEIPTLINDFSFNPIEVN